MLKRILSLLLCLMLLGSSALAGPLTLLDDLSDKIVSPDDYGGVFSYSYHYPQVDDQAEGGAAVNYFYSELISYDLYFTVPIIQEAYEGENCSTVITYTVTCNNDDFFSVLICKEEVFPEFSRTSWIGNTFSRKNPKYDQTYTLPELLGILTLNENDVWKQDRQRAKADTLLREMVWKMIEDNPDGIEYDDHYTEDNLASDFFPEEQFYLDENGNPVFFLQPGVAADESVGLLKFPISLEEILDEL